MSGKGPLVVEEIGGDRFPDLETVQRLALKPMASDLAAILRLMLANGTLASENGSIILKGKEETGL